MAHRMAIALGAASLAATAFLMALGTLDGSGPSVPEGAPVVVAIAGIGSDPLAAMLPLPEPPADGLSLEPSLMPATGLAEAAKAAPLEFAALAPTPTAPTVFALRPAFAEEGIFVRFASLAPEQPAASAPAVAELPPARPGFAETELVAARLLAVRPPARPAPSAFQVVSIDPAATALASPLPATADEASTPAAAPLRPGLFGGWSLPELPPITPGIATRGPDGGAPQAGLASWYGPGFHGRRTASGEVFNQHDLTAAHRHLPFGTRVRVVDETTGRSVVVRINDRGPFKRGRIIDLSKGSAQALGIAGLKRVKIVSAEE